MALAVVLVLTGCSQGAPEGSAAANAASGAADGAATVFAADERVDAPEVSGTDLDGEEISLADYAGRILVLNIWASWCGPCRAEQPVLDEVYAEYQELGVDFLGVNTKDDETAARAYTNAQEVAYPSLYDQPGEITQAFRDTVPPRAIPSTLIIDPEGRIAARVIGATTYGQLTGLLDPIVVEYGFGDPAQRPRAADPEAPPSAEPTSEISETGER
ncbi:TlpA family protein disulfide reductase [Nocardiopsis dassonvillei]|uniref:TlpA family protein disulfide reductase n=1 Tax=Nocardiopsis dassonvillei TaxID=2014 RepID=UPI00200D770E|nr:TlpA disulfide reductase family protein [Nocardiopsis dassonvillei]MCK9871388.1 TlpA family protein disulfide reductase [Nocardiopsis dassonvillei]